MSIENEDIKVAIIEDLREVREGLCYLIGSTPGFVCTGSFGSMEEGLQQLGQNLPAVVLLDIGLPGMDGIAGTRLFKECWPQLVIVILTIYDDDDRIFAVLCAGASGYLLKNTPPTRLVEGLREVVKGGGAMAPEIAGKVIRLFRAIRPPTTADYHLTPHELRILSLLVEGHSYKTVAERLKSCVNTVAFHMKSIYRKLEVHSKSEAVAKALQNRLV